MKHHRTRLHHKANRVCPAVCLAGMLAAYTSAAADGVARIPQHTYWQSRAKIFYRLCAPEKREAERVRMENLMTKLYEINKPKPQRVVLRHEAHERPSSG